MPLIVKRGDTRPARWLLMEQEGDSPPTPIDLTGATLVVHVRERGKPSSPLLTLPGTIIPPATDGRFTHQYDTVPVGTFDLQVEMTNGTIATAPTVGNETLVVQPDLG
jgi:hypothetical protein